MDIAHTPENLGLILRRTAAAAVLALSGSILISDQVEAGTAIPNFPVVDSCKPGPGVNVKNNRSEVVHAKFKNQRTGLVSNLILGSGDAGYFAAAEGDTVQTTIDEEPGVIDTETVNSCSTSSSVTTSTTVTPNSTSSSTSPNAFTSTTTSPNVITTTTVKPVASPMTTTTTSAVVPTTTILSNTNPVESQSGPSLTIREGLLQRTG